MGDNKNLNDLMKEAHRIIDNATPAMHIINLTAYDGIDMGNTRTYTDIKALMQKDRDLTIICNDLHANILNVDTLIVYGNIDKGCVIEADKCLVLNGNEKYCEAVVNEKDHYDISKEKVKVEKSGEDSAEPNYIPNGYPGSAASYAERAGNGTSNYEVPKINLPKLKIHPPVEIKE